MSPPVDKVLKQQSPLATLQKGILSALDIVACDGRTHHTVTRIPGVSHSTAILIRVHCVNLG